MTLAVTFCSASNPLSVAFDASVISSPKSVGSVISALSGALQPVAAVRQAEHVEVPCLTTRRCGSTLSSAVVVTLKAVLWKSPREWST